MPDLAELITDPKRETEGVWFDFDLLPPDKVSNGNGEVELRYMRFRLARKYTPEYNALFQELLEKHDAAMRAGGRFRADAQNMIMRQVCAEITIRDWENVVFEGQELPFTTENALLILNKHGLGKQLMTWIDNKTDRYTAYRVVENEADRKN
jgi:hypothetical protein